MLTDDDRRTILAAIDAIAHHAPHEEDGALVAKLRAIAARPSIGTVGELLATAPVGSIVEWCNYSGEWQRLDMRNGPGAVEYWGFSDGWRSDDGYLWPSSLRLPGRLVPVSEADRDPHERCPL